jgi:hypothetical protein
MTVPLSVDIGDPGRLLGNSASFIGTEFIGTEFIVPRQVGPLSAPLTALASALVAALGRWACTNLPDPVPWTPAAL